MTQDLIDATLAQHHTWDVRIMKGLMVCKGCTWSRKPRRGESNTGAFREHQADMIAQVLAEAPPAPEAPGGHREDLTVFAALIARLGGDVVITWQEARRLTGVAVTRWDEPEMKRYRFTLNSPTDIPDTPAELAALHPQKAADPHQCESWQIRRNADGDRYCAACGVTQ